MVTRIVLSLVLTLFSSAAIAADVTLFDLSGEWRGTGLVRPEMDKNLREGRCRMAASTSDIGNDLTLSGRCATDIGASRLTMRFIRHDGGAITGAVASPSLPEPLQFLGRYNGGMARLETREVVDIEGVKGSNHFTLSVIDAGTFDLVEVFRPDNGSGDIEFVRLHFVRVGDGG